MSVVSSVRVVAYRLLRRALSAIYLTIGFFLMLIWLWGDYLGITIIAIAYLVAASVVYDYVFRPLIRFKDLSPLMRGPSSTKIAKVLGLIASALGLIALTYSVLIMFVEAPRYIAPLIGILATLVSIAILTYYIVKSKLASATEVVATANLALAVITYLIVPHLTLPITGTIFLIIGTYGYLNYYLKA